MRLKPSLACEKGFKVLSDEVHDGITQHQVVPGKPTNSTMAAAENVQIRRIASRGDFLDDLQQSGHTFSVDEHTIAGFLAVSAGSRDGNAGSYDGMRKTAQPQSRRSILPLGLEHHFALCQPAARLTGQMHLKRRVAVLGKFHGLKQFSQLTNRLRIVAAQTHSREQLACRDLHHREIKLQEDGFFYPTSELPAYPRAVLVQEPTHRGLAGSKLCEHRVSHSIPRSGREAASAPRWTC